MNPNDLELLSAYIDGTLSAEERAAVESRLADEADLRRDLASLQATVSLLGAMPELRAPRDLRLTRAMVGPQVQRRPPIALFSALSAAAAFVLIALGVIGLGSTTLPAPDAAQVAVLATNTITAASLPQTLPPAPTESVEIVAESLAFEAAPGSDASDEASFSQRAGETSPALTATMMSTAPAPIMDAQPAAGNAMPTQPPMQIMQALGGAEMQAAPAEDVLNFAAEAEMAAPAAVEDVQESGMAAGSIVAAVPMPQGTLPMPTLAQLPPFPTQIRAEQPTDTLTNTPTDTATSTNTATSEPTETPVPTAAIQPTPQPPPVDSDGISQNTGSVILIVVGVLLLIASVAAVLLRRPR